LNAASSTTLSGRSAQKTFGRHDFVNALKFKPTSTNAKLPAFGQLKRPGLFAPAAIGFRPPAVQAVGLHLSSVQ
jgi:hypothetical protein